MRDRDRERERETKGWTDRCKRTHPSSVCRLWMKRSNRVSIHLPRFPTAWKFVRRANLASDPSLFVSLVDNLRFIRFHLPIQKKKKKKKSDFRLCQSLFLYSLVSFRFYTRNFSLCYTDPSGNFVLEMALIVWSWERSLESFLTASYKVPRVCVPVYFTTILNSFFFSSNSTDFSI